MGGDAPLGNNASVCEAGDGAEFLPTALFAA
jgi:hypothetical protein